MEEVVEERMDDMLRSLFIRLHLQRYVHSWVAMEEAFIFPLFWHSLSEHSTSQWPTLHFSIAHSIYSTIYQWSPIKEFPLTSIVQGLQNSSLFLLITCQNYLDVPHFDSVTPQTNPYVVSHKTKV